MLTYKVTRPSTPPCIERPLLLARALSRPVVALCAPAGHGKTCFAAQIADASAGPAAWFTADEFDRDPAGVVGQVLAALAHAWPELPAVDEPDDTTAVALLAATLETVAGPGIVVLDDLHLLPPDLGGAVLGAALAALPSTCRLVVCTHYDPAEVVVRADAAGQATTFVAADLLFTPDDCV